MNNIKTETKDKLPKVLLPMLEREFPVLTRPRAINSYFEPIDTKKGKEIQLMQINAVLKTVLSLYKQGKVYEAMDDIEGILECLKIRGYDKEHPFGNYPDDYIDRSPKKSLKEIMEKWSKMINAVEKKYEKRH